MTFISCNHKRSARSCCSSGLTSTKVM